MQGGGGRRCKVGGGAWRWEEVQGGGEEIAGRCGKVGGGAGWREGGVRRCEETVGRGKRCQEMQGGREEVAEGARMQA